MNKTKYNKLKNQIIEAEKELESYDINNFYQALQKKEYKERLEQLKMEIDIIHGLYDMDDYLEQTERYLNNRW